MADIADQPDDETPLRTNDTSESDALFDYLFTSASSQLGQAAGEVSDEFDGIIDRANADLDDALSDVDFAFTDIVVDGFEQLTRANASVDRAFNAIVKMTDESVNAAIDDLFEVGIAPPVAIHQIVRDLVNGNLETFQSYFPAGAFTEDSIPAANGADSIPMGGEPGQQGPPVDGCAFHQDAATGLYCYTNCLPEEKLHGDWPDCGPDSQTGSPPPPPDEPIPVPGLSPPCVMPTAQDIINAIGYTPSGTVLFKDATGKYCDAVYDPSTGSVLPNLPSTHVVAVTSPTVSPGTVGSPASCPSPTVVSCPTSVPAPVVNVVVKNDMTGTCPAPTSTPPPPTTAPPTTKPPETPAPPEKPPPPPPPKPPKPDLPRGNSVDWAHPTACEKADSLCSELSSAQAPETQATGQAGGKDQTWWDYLVSGVTGLAAPGKALAIGFNTFLSENPIVSDSLSRAFQTLAATAAKSFDAFAPNGVHNKNAAAFYMARLGVANFVSKWAGIPMDYYLTCDKYEMQFCDPQFMPTQEECDLVYLRDIWDHDQWTCHTKANGNIPLYYNDVINAKSARPDPLAVIELYRRGVIKNKKDLTKRLRELGYLNEQYTEELLITSSETLQYGDLIRCMVRDTFDKDVVEKYQYDKDFTKKFTDKAKEYADILGLPEDVARQIWRAHWQFPSDTALYDMLHRFPPDRPEAVAWNAQAAAVQSAGGGLAEPPGKPVVVTVEDVKRALEINDLAPEFVDAMVARSYHPINTSDGVRFYQQGTFSSEDLYWVYRKNGYNADDSKRSVEAQSHIKARTLANASGVWTVRKIIRSYKAGEIGPEVAKNLLRDIMPDEQQRMDLLQGADLETRAEMVRTCTKAIKRRFMLGEWETQETGIRLQGIGVDPNRINVLLSQWECDRASRLREPRVAMLCEWYTRGLLTADDYFTRLIRLGFSSSDSVRIARTCHDRELLRRATKAAQAAEKSRKEFIAEERTQRKEFEKWEKERQEKYAALVQAIQEAEAKLAALSVQPALPEEPPGSTRNGSH